MMPPVPIKKFTALIVALGAVEREAHELGLHATAHAINGAKNQAGWEQAERKLGANIDKAIRPTRKRAIRKKK